MIEIRLMSPNNLEVNPPMTGQTVNGIMRLTMSQSWRWNADLLSAHLSGFIAIGFMTSFFIGAVAHSMPYRLAWPRS